jgi:hypothetical protein
MCPHATVHITISHVTAATTPYSARPSCSLTDKIFDPKAAVLGVLLAVSLLFGSGTSDGRDAIFEFFSFSFFGIEFSCPYVLV